MKKRNNIFIFVSALLLSAALLLPSAFKFVHIFEGHEHKSCSDLTTHLHEKKIDCNIDQFNLSFFNLELQSFKLSLPEVRAIKKAFCYEEHLLISDKRFIKLRGPPFAAV